MKLSLKFLSLLLVFANLTGILLACKDKTSSQTPVDDSMISITDEFTVTRPERPTDVEQESALTIRSSLEAIGVDARVQDDWYKFEDTIPKNEILVGKTNRQESIDALSKLGNERDFSISVHGSKENGFKVVIAATGDKGLTAAVEYFISTYLSSAESNKLSTTLSYNYVFSFPCENITLGESATPLADYTIVYANDGVTSALDPNYGTFVQAAKYEDVALALAESLSDAANVNLNVIPQTSATSDGTPKIIVGKTDLPDDDFAYKSKFSDIGSYIGKLNAGGNVILAGDNACAVYAAGEAFVDALINAKTALTEFSIEDTKTLIKVACVGDSITHGSTSDDINKYNYPVYLQRLLGYDYYVEKHGAPGISMAAADPYAYVNFSSMYSATQALRPDVVIIMLGTNDCNPYDAAKDWSNPSRARSFTASANAMVKAYRRKNKDVQIYFMTPPTVPSSTAWNSNVKDYAVPLVTQAATDNECYLIDIYTWSTRNTKVFAADGLHPKNETYGDLAQAVYDGLKDTVKKPE